MELNVGRLIPASFLPDVRFLSHLESITKRKKVSHTLISKIYDQRISKKNFGLIFRNEILELYKWLLKRAIFSSTEQNISKHKFLFKKAHVFLPEHAPAIHMIRRVAPFACLGIPVCCYFKPVSAINSRLVASALLRYFKLEKKVMLSVNNPSAILDKIDHSKSIIVVTGHRETVLSIKSKIKKANLVAATGRCSVLITDTIAKARGIRKKLVSELVHKSCTTLKASFITCDTFDKNGLIHSLSTRSVKRRIKKILPILHPSIIYTHTKCKVAKWGAKYCIKPVSVAGLPENLEGLGADPFFGWPGDYLL